MEKIHGTSAHISWNGQEVKFFAGGGSHEAFVALFDVPKLTSEFVKLFGADQCVVFGESYGGKQQGMSHTYGKESRFIVFDVKVGDCWLAVPQAENVAQTLGLEFVYYKQIPTTLEAIDAERDAPSVQAVRNGIAEPKPREGVVLRPLIEMTKNNGARIVSKHKGEAFAERQNVPKVVDAEKLEQLKDAELIATEWVTANRLDHVLQKFPEDVGMEQTRDIIKAMIEDVYREAKGEIVEGQNVAAAISKATAKMWKARIANRLRDKT